jgi:hypothetical protein
MLFLNKNTNFWPSFCCRKTCENYILQIWSFSDYTKNHAKLQAGTKWITCLSISPTSDSLHMTTLNLQTTEQGISGFNWKKNFRLLNPESKATVEYLEVSWAGSPVVNFLKIFPQVIRQSAFTHCAFAAYGNRRLCVENAKRLIFWSDVCCQISAKKLMLKGLRSIRLKLSANVGGSWYLFGLDLD